MKIERIDHLNLTVADIDRSALLRSALEQRLGRVLHDAFPFAGGRCRRIADRVVAALRDRA